MTKLLTVKSNPVSPLCFGTMQFGGASDFKESELIFNKCREVGINFFDTAEIYPVMPRQETYGRTEEIIGDWFQKKRTRDKVIIASKIAQTLDFFQQTSKHCETCNINIEEVFFFKHFRCCFGTIGYNPFLVRFGCRLSR